MTDQPPTRRRGGAPIGNLNAMKHGRHSGRVQAMATALRALQGNPEVARALKLDRHKRQVLALTYHTFADLLLAHPEGVKTTDELIPVLMQKAYNRANKRMETTSNNRRRIEASAAKLLGKSRALRLEIDAQEGNPQENNRTTGQPCRHRASRA